MNKQHHKRQSPKPPMLVLREIEKDVETQEWMCLTALMNGVAQRSHYDFLAKMLNMLLIAGDSAKHRQPAFDYADKVFKPVMASIKARHKATGKLGVNSHELTTLRKVVQFNHAFWQKQPGELYVNVHAEVEAFYASLERTK